jgi:hypothetical protein
LSIQILFTSEQAGDKFDKGKERAYQYVKSSFPTERQEKEVEAPTFNQIQALCVTAKSRAIDRVKPSKKLCLIDYDRCIISRHCPLLVFAATKTQPRCLYAQ